MKWLRPWVVAAAALALNGSACDAGVECTEIGCVDGVLFDLLPADGTWADGAYTLTVTFDGIEHRCEFQLPDALPRSGSISSLDCGDLTAEIAPRVTCTETRNGGSVSQSCTPIPDQYDLLLSAYATPAESSITLARDGETILSDARTLDYDESRPNGEECEPACRQAHVELDL